MFVAELVGSLCVRIVVVATAVAPATVVVADPLLLPGVRLFVAWAVLPIVARMSSGTVPGCAVADLALTHWLAVAMIAVASLVVACCSVLFVASSPVDHLAVSRLVVEYIATFHPYRRGIRVLRTRWIVACLDWLGWVMY